MKTAFDYLDRIAILEEMLKLIYADIGKGYLIMNYPKEETNE